MASSPTYPPYLFNTPAWSDALGWGVDKPQCYSTIHCADVTGNGQADILARSATGIVGAYLCKKLGGRLIRLPSGPLLSDRDGYDHPQYYETIQYADVDGDGHAELIVRRSGGIDLFKLNDPASDRDISKESPILPSFMTWSTLATNDPAWSDEAGWDEAQYYSTIQAADIDGDGRAELLARNADGMMAFAYDLSTQQWQQITPKTTKVPFPQYAGEERKAYNYISAKLLPNAVNPSIREQYNKGGINPAAWTSKLTPMRSDHHFSEEAWHTVKTQLLHEFACVASVQAYFSQANSLITRLVLSRSLIVPAVSGSVGITTQKSSSGVFATLMTMILGIVNAVAIVVSDGAGVAAGIFASVMGAALADDPSGGSTVIYAADDLDNWIETQFTNSSTASTYYEQDVLCDWGLLHTLGTVAGGGGPWERSAEYVNTAVDAAEGAFRLWVYQKLMPVKYPAITLFQPPVTYLNLDAAKCEIPSQARLIREIDATYYDFYFVDTSSSPVAFPTSDCMNEIWSLGATKEDFFFRKDGWDQFKTKSAPPPPV